MTGEAPKALRKELRAACFKARKLILDEFGRELDEDGQVVPMRPQAVCFTLFFAAQ